MQGAVAVALFATGKSPQSVSFSVDHFTRSVVLNPRSIGDAMHVVALLGDLADGAERGPQSVSLSI
jgi:hypothetical protein